MVAHLTKSILELSQKGALISVEESGQLLTLVSNLFVRLMRDAGHSSGQITKITTKLRDSGRRSPPWKKTSSTVIGLPQDGNDGNRINRWLLPEDHKFYANQLNANLVELRYYLQCLSMSGAPLLDESLQRAFSWLIEHPVIPGQYLDPIQKININLDGIVDQARAIQSGHLIPLDRGGKHVPGNTFLMLARSNQLQGNLTIAELLQLMRDIVSRHELHA